MPKRKGGVASSLDAHEGVIRLGDAGGETWYRISGNGNGVPVVILHGGPGYHSDASDTRFFDTGRFCIVQYDQRGCGRTTPRASSMTAEQLAMVTVDRLIADLEELHRRVMGRRPWVVFGSSWGSALAIMYAARHPKQVLGLILHGVYCGSPEEHAPLFADQYAAARTVLASVIPAVDTHRDDPLELHLAAGRFIAAAEPVAALRALLLWEQYENYVTYPAERPAYLRLMQRTAEAAAPHRVPTDVDQSLLQLRLFPEMMQRVPLFSQTVLEPLRAVPVAVVHGADDDVCPTASAEKLVAALRAVKGCEPAAGEHGSGSQRRSRISVRFALVPGSSHMAEDAAGEKALRDAADWMWGRCTGMD